MRFFSLSVHGPAPTHEVLVHLQPDRPFAIFHFVLDDRPIDFSFPILTPGEECLIVCGQVYSIVPIHLFGGHYENIKRGKKSYWSQKVATFEKKRKAEL